MRRAGATGRPRLQNKPQTTNKKLPSGVAPPGARGRPGCQADAHAGGDPPEPGSAPSARLGGSAAGPPTPPRGGRQGARPSGGGPRAHAPRAATTHAQEAPDGKREGTFLGHAESRQPTGGPEAGRAAAAVGLRGNASPRGGARARGGRGGGAGPLPGKRAGTGSALAERVKGSRGLGAAARSRPGTAPASSARGLPARHADGGHAHTRARRRRDWRGWQGKRRPRERRRSPSHGAESGGREARHYSPVHGTQSRPAGDGAEAQE